jgi:ADP-ribose pyrophosphatase YjhB (NUDIX family)
MDSMPFGSEEKKEGYFLWLAPFAPERGWRNVPPGGMCLCAFLFVASGGKILLGKYADHPAWGKLSGMESERVIANARGWTIPASHLKFGEDPREAVRRIGAEILMLDKEIIYSEPYVKTFLYEPESAPGENHYDVHFLFDVSLEAGTKVPKPPWYEAVEWLDIEVMQSKHFARQHGDVAEAWLRKGAAFSHTP